MCHTVAAGVTARIAGASGASLASTLDAHSSGLFFRQFPSLITTVSVPNTNLTNLTDQ